MKCDICGERHAVIFVQQISKDSSTELHLCEPCARARGFSTSGDKIDISLGGLFSGAVEGSSAASRRDNACPVCGLSLDDVKRRMKAGCAECYHHFRGEIVSILRREGIEVAYQGALPARLESFKATRADPEGLRKELQKAIAEEDYELAAYYRDRIKALGEDSK